MNDRISTGNREADEILAGGFPRNSINIIMGLPGTGKTVFAEELVFHNANVERPVLYLTTLSEPIAKIVKYLEQFSFFDATKLNTSVRYRDIGGNLVKDGIGALLTAINAAIREFAPQIIVVDSFKAIHDLAPSSAEMRRMLFDLTGTLTAFDTTAFFLGEYTDEHARQLPEFAVADSILQFLRTPMSSRDERFLRVLKLRGSSYSEGQHGFRITTAGVKVFPRLTSPDFPETYKVSEERLSWGVPGADALFDGGIWRGSTTLLAGPTGAGKTMMALKFVLEGAERGEPSLFVNFQENPTQLRRTLSSMGFEETSAARKHLHLLYYSPVELQIDSVVVQMFKRIQRDGIQRVVIDAVGDLLMAAADPQRLHDYLYALVQHFAVKGVTCILNCETAGGVAPSESVGGRFSYMSDNIVLITNEVLQQVTRRIVVLKSRGTAHDLRVHRVEIGNAGVEIKRDAPKREIS